MAEETIKKLHKHFSELAEIGGTTGNPVRNALIKSDAISNKEALEKKFSSLLNGKGKAGVQSGKKGREDNSEGDKGGD